METIFDYNPTKEELVELFGYDEANNTMAYGFAIWQLPIDEYANNTSDEEKLLDLAKLHELRNETQKAKSLWAQIPDIERQYRGGFDDKAYPVDM